MEPNAFYRGSMAARAKRSRGEIEALPSGSLRVRVYAGIDPVTRKRHHLTEIIPPGPRAAKEAEKARTRLLSQVDQQRNPRTRATVNQMLDRHLEMLGVEETTLDSYEGFVRNHIRPLIGTCRWAGSTARSWTRSTERSPAAAHTATASRSSSTAPSDEHDCDERCKPHVCRPLAAASLLKIQAILNKAGKRAVRWEWIGRNPFELAEPIPLSALRAAAADRGAGRRDLRRGLAGSRLGHDGLAS